MSQSKGERAKKEIWNGEKVKGSGAEIPKRQGNP